MGGPPRIGYLTTTDPADRRSWSGIHATMLDELRRRFPNVITLGPFGGGLPSLLGRVLNRAMRSSTGLQFDHAHGTVLAHHYARAVERRVARAGVDIIIAPSASSLVAQARLRVPYILLSDSTIANMVDYYPAYSSLAAWSRRQGMRTEDRAVRGATFAVYPSRWAAGSAVRDHGADPDRVQVIPFGANIRCVPPEQEALAPRPMDTLRLLFIGVEWERKGGPLVLDTVERLRATGLPVHLTIVGLRPPIASAPHITVVPFIDKNDPVGERRIRDLLLEHHFLFVPSQSECYGIVFCEAASCGTPSIARFTGGIEGAIAEGVSGHLLPPDATGTAYADVIAQLWSAPARYAALQRSARALYDRTHNWRHWGEAMEQLVGQALR